MTTKGDQILDKPLSQIGDKGLFTKELEDALLSEKVDLIVHSFKDCPTKMPHPELAIGAVLKREDTSDSFLLSKKHADLKIESLSDFITKVPSTVTIGTSALRRQAQLNRLHGKDIKVESIRGNLNTRLRKLDDKELPYDGIILAKAGVNRMGEEFTSRVSCLLNPPDFLYAVSQAALGIEIRKNDIKTLNAVQNIADIESTFTCLAERACMRTLEGGCTVPIGVSSELVEVENGKNLSLTCAVWSVDGKVEIKASSNRVIPNDISEAGYVAEIFTQNSKSAEICDQLGVEVAEKLLDLGAKEVLCGIRK